MGTLYFRPVPGAASGLPPPGVCAARPRLRVRRHPLRLQPGRPGWPQGVLPLTQQQLEGLAKLRDLLDRDPGRLTAFLREQLAADLAEWLEELNEAERTAVFRLLDSEQAAEVLGELDLDTQADLVAALGKEKAGDIIEEMPSDEAADLLAELTPEEQGQILGELEAENAAEVRELLTFDPDTAGGLMTTDFITLREDMTAEQAIAHLRKVGPDAETIYYVYVVNGGGQLVGVISLRDLIVAPPQTRIREVMRTRVISVRADQDQEEVAKLVSKYNLLAVPVVDDQQRILGVVTVDDVLDVMEEEATEDVLRMGAAGAPVEEEEKASFLSAVWAIARPRLPWLVSLLFLEMGSGVIASFFHNFVSETTAALLALFTVVMAGESGNAATQSLAVVVRGLATGEIRQKEMLRVVAREAATGLIVGAVCGLVLMVTAALWHQSWTFGAAVGLALLANLFLAKLLGGLFPLVINRLGIDPAVASGPLITTLTDNTSMLVYYGTAALLLAKLGT